MKAITIFLRALAFAIVPLMLTTSAWAVDLKLGDILVVDPNAGPPAGQGAVIQIDAQTGSQTVISSGNYLQESTGIVVSNLDGKIYVTDRVNGLIRVDPATGAQTLVSSGQLFADPFGITRDSHGNIYVADSGFDPNRSVNVPGKIIRVDPATGNQSLVAQGLNIVHPYGIAVDDSDRIVVSDMSAFNGQGGIIRINPANGNQTVLWGPAAAQPLVTQSAPFACPMGIAVEAGGTILATTFTYGTPTPYYGCSPSGIFRVDLLYGTQSTVSANPPVAWQLPFGLDTELNGNIIVPDEGWGAIYRLDVYGQFIAPTPFSQSGHMLQPSALTVVKFLPVQLNAGDILVVDALAGPPSGKGAVIRIDPQTRVQTLITFGKHLEQSVGIAEDMDDRKIVVADRYNGVIHIDPATGEQTVLASGGFLVDPFGIAIDPISNDIFIADSGYNPYRDGGHGGPVNVPGKIIRINRQTGTQSIVAQGGFLVHPYGIATDPISNMIFVTDMSAFNGQGAVVRIDPANGTQTLLWGPADAVPAPVVAQSAPLACPMGIVMEPAGTVLVTAFQVGLYGCANASIYRLNFDNGTQTTVSATPQVSWQIPFGLAIERDQNIIVSDEGWGAIYRLAPSGQFIAPTPFSQGGYMLQPPGVAIVLPNPRCLSCP